MNASSQLLILSFILTRLNSSWATFSLFQDFCNREKPRDSNSLNLKDECSSGRKVSYGGGNYTAQHKAKCAIPFPTPTLEHLCLSLKLSSLWQQLHSRPPDLHVLFSPRITPLSLTADPASSSALDLWPLGIV